MAPIQGYTDYIWRDAQYQVFGGIDTFYSPFVRVERGGFRARDLRDISKPNNSEIDFVPQILACNHGSMQLLIDKMRELDYHEVDINLGCPFPVIARKGYGAGMLASPFAIKELCAMVSSHHEIRFSFKMRLGYRDAKDWEAVLPYIEEVEPAHITIHGRTAEQQYSGDINFSEIDRLYERCKSPLIYNGEVQTIEDVERLYAKYPRLKGIMIGRALLRNPGLLVPGKCSTAHYKTFHDRVYTRYSQRLEGGEAQLLMKMKTMWDYFLEGADKKLIKKIKKSSSIEKYEIAVDNLWNNIDLHF